MENEDQRQYELTFILSPELKEKDIDSFEQEVEKDIKNFGGSLKKKGKLEKRDLAYPIKKFQFAYYLIVSFLLNPEKIEELSAVFKHKKEVLRSIIAFIEEPSIVKGKEKKRRKKKEKKEFERFEEVAREITEEEVEATKRIIKEKKEKEKEKEKKKEIKLEEIDKKLDEILGI